MAHTSPSVVDKYIKSHIAVGIANENKTNSKNELHGLFEDVWTRTIRLKAESTNSSSKQNRGNESVSRVLRRTYHIENPNHL